MGGHGGPKPSLCKQLASTATTTTTATTGTTWVSAAMGKIASSSTKAREVAVATAETSPTYADNATASATLACVQLLL